MIELTSLNGAKFVLNSRLIETMHKIPETKITLTNEKYFLVSETQEQVLDLIIEYNRKIYVGGITKFN